MFLKHVLFSYLFTGHISGTAKAIAKIPPKAGTYTAYHIRISMHAKNGVKIQKKKF